MDREKELLRLKKELQWVKSLLCVITLAGSILFFSFKNEKDGIWKTKQVILKDEKGNSYIMINEKPAVNPPSLPLPSPAGIITQANPAP